MQQERSLESNQVGSRPTQPGNESKFGNSTTAKIVVLNGFLGIGKLTILKYVKELLSATNTHLLDNHLLVDLVTTIIPKQSKEHYSLQRQVQAPIFEMIRKVVLEGYVFLLTACLATNDNTGTAFF